MISITDELSTGRPSMIADAMTLKRTDVVSPWQPTNANAPNDVSSPLLVVNDSGMVPLHFMIGICRLSIDHLMTAMPLLTWPG
ncbi:hypothetical protein B5K11_07290 [Rhizobium leguminosarum bv. trifolii]|nr:hypothetical protein B5K11_07290 [Rhizobium leguminosarum bv. trifolii]